LTCIEQQNQKGSDSTQRHIFNSKKSTRKLK